MFSLHHYEILADRSDHSEFYCTRVDSGRGQTVTPHALTSGPSRFYRLATPLLVESPAVFCRSELFTHIGTVVLHHVFKS